MERKIEIPEMDQSELLKLAKVIRPIVYFKHSTPVYLRPLTDDEVSGVAYTWLKEPTDYNTLVDYSQLSVLADLKMLHDYGYPGSFKPSVGEVIRQIPNNLLEKAVAFEMLYGPLDFHVFRAELNAGYHVSVVRLYQANANNNAPATQPTDTWPTKTSSLPIGMSEVEFNWLLKNRF